MTSRRTVALVVGALLVVSVAGVTVAVAQTGGIVTGEPRLNVDAPDATLTPGAPAELELQVSNDGQVSLGAPEQRDVVTAARNVRVEAEGEGPIEVETNRQSIGTVRENEPRSALIEVSVTEDADPGEYEIDVELRYKHTSRIERGAGVLNERRRTVTRTVDIEVDDGPRFDIETVADGSQVGDTGTVTAELENVGNEPASDLSVQFSTDPERSQLSLGEEASVRQLDPGETTEIEFDAAVSPDANPRGYTVQTTIAFDDSDGIRSADSPRRLTVTPAPKQRFSFEDVESTLRVGEDGDLRGTVTNDGPTTAGSVTVRFVDESPNVIPIESSVAVGTLSPGESAEFRLPIELTREAEAVSRNFDMAVAYRNADNERRAFEDIDVSADVAEQRDEFLLDIDDREVAAGSATLVEVNVTNNLDQTASDIEAKLFTNDPLGSDDDEGYIESLDPGETTTVTFRVSAEADATPRTYPLQMDFRYDDESGTSKVSDTYRTAIDVTDADDSGLPWTFIGVGVLILAAIGGALYWRRRG